MASYDARINEFLTRKRPDLRLNARLNFIGANPEAEIAGMAARTETLLRSSQLRQQAILKEGGAAKVSIAQQDAASITAIQERAALSSLAISEQTSARQIVIAQREANLRRAIAEKQRAEALLMATPRRAGVSGAMAGASASAVGNSLAMGLTLPAVVTAGLALKVGKDWESAFADVRKTVDGSVSSLRNLGLELRSLAAGKNAIPIDAKELAAIAASAGALGIHLPNIAEFTRTMAMLGTATNLSSTEAAKGLARIDNVMQSGQKNFDRYGSALVHLGNNSAALENEIVAMSQRLTGEAHQIGLLPDQVLAVGAALASVGVRSEAGGSSFSAFWKKTDAAVRGGGKSLEEFARVARQSSAEFKKSWETDAAGATVAFVEGLGKIKAEGGSAAGTLDALGIKERREQDSLLRLAGAGNVLATSLRLGSTAWRENTALATEANKRYETTASQWQILLNRSKELAMQGSEVVLPGVNKEIKGFSEGLPDTANKAAAAYEALGPMGQKVAVGLLAVGVTAGPILKVSGAVLTLVGHLKTLGAFVLPATLTSSLASLAPLLANPLVAIPLLVIALGGGAIAWENYKASMDDALVSQHNAEMSARSLAEALQHAQKFAGGSASAKSALGKLQDEAKDAGQDTGKLIALIKKATAEKVTIGKDMALDPISKVAVQNDLQRFINNLSAQTIELNVSLTGAVDVARGKKSVAAQWANSEDTMQQRAARARVALPVRPPDKLPASFWQKVTTGSDTIDNSAAVNRYNGALDVAISKIQAFERVQQKAGQTGRAAAQNATQAVTEQNKAVSKLTDAELAHEKKRLEALAKAGKFKLGAAGFNGAAYERALDVRNEAQARAAKAKKPAVAATTAPVEDAASREKIERAEREFTERLIALQEKRIGEIEQLWNGFGNQVESVLGGINRVGDGDNLREFAAQTAMARADFAGIPPELKQVVAGIAAIGDEMDKLTKTRDNLRGYFGGLFKEALSGGGDTAGVARQAALFSARLNYSARMESHTAQANAMAARPMARVGSVQNSVNADREHLDVLRQSNSGKDDVAASTDAGARVAQVMMQRHISGASRGFVRRCEELAETNYYQAGVTAYDAVLRQKGSALQTMRRFQKAGIGQKFTPGMAMAPGGLLYSDTMGGGYGHVQTIGTDGARYDQYGRDKFKQSNFGWYVPPPGTPVKPFATARPQLAPSSSQGTKNKEWARAQSGNFDDDLLGLGLPKGFGGAVTNLKLATGEVRDAQRQAQELVLNKKEFAKLLDEVNGGLKSRGQKPMSADQLAGELRSGAKQFDHAMAVAKVANANFEALRDMGRQTRLVGKENNPYLVLLEEFNSGADRLLDAHGKGQKASAVLGLMNANIRQETRDARAEMQRQVLGLRAVAPLLDNPDNSGATYDRALHEETARRDIWKEGGSADNQLKAANRMKEEAAELRKNGDLVGANTKHQQAAREAKEANAQATIKLATAMQLYDAQTSADTLRQVAQATKEKKDALDVQRYVNDLLARGYNPDDAEMMGEVEGAKRARRATLQPSVKAGEITSAQADKSASEAGDLVASAQQSAKRNKSLTEERTNALAAQNAVLEAQKEAELFLAATAREKLAIEFRYQDLLKGGKVKVSAKEKAARQTQLDLADSSETSAKDREIGDMEATHTGQIASLKNQRALVESYRSGSRELDMQLQIERKRGELLTRNATTHGPKRTDDELARELAIYEEEVRAQGELSRLEAERAGALQAENALIEMRKAAEMATVNTARERLAIEFKFQDLLSRGEVGISPEEQAARNQQLDQADMDERMEGTRKMASQTHSMMSDAVYTGLRDGSAKGVRSMIQNLRDSMMHQFADDTARSLTNKMYRGRAGGEDALPRAESSIWDALRPGRKKGELAVPILAGARENVMRASYEVKPHKSNALKQLEAFALGAGGGLDGVNGGKSLAHATIQVTRAEIAAPGAEINVTGIGAGAGMGSGAGSSPSTEQVLGALGSAGSYASNALSIFGGMKKNGLF